MNLFSTYESELVDLVGQANTTLAQMGSGKVSRPDGKKKLKELLAECGENFEGMDMAVRNAPADKKAAMKARVVACREQVDKVRVQALAIEKEGADRAALLGEGDEDGDLHVMENKSGQQLQAEQMTLMRRGDDHLLEALREAREMEEVAITISTDLSNQHDQIVGMQDRLVEINANIDRSEGLMRQMYRRLMFNKIVFGVGATAVVGAVSLVVLKIFVV